MRLSTKTYQERKLDLMWILNIDDKVFTDSVKKDMHDFIKWECIVYADAS